MKDANVRNFITIKKVFSIAFLSIPVIFYAWVVLTYARNIPFFDDFYWSFEFFEDYLKTNGSLEKIELLFKQHNQHRIAYFRAVMLALFTAENELNFRHLVIIGNLSIFGTGILLYFFLKNLGKSTIYFLPIAFVWFQLQYYHNTIVSYGVPNLAVIFFSVASFFFATQKAGRFYFFLALLCGGISIFSNGNGIIVLPILLFIFALQQYWKRVFIAFLWYLILLGGYFYHFQMDASEAKINHKTLAFFFDFLGTSFVSGNSTVSQYIAVVIYFFLAILFLKLIFIDILKNKRLVGSEMLFVMGVFLFLMGTAAMTAIVRAIHNIEIPTWYKNYSLLFIILFYLATLVFFKKNTLQRVILSLFAFFSVFTWYKTSFKLLPLVDAFVSTLEADAYNFQQHGNWSFLPAQVGLPTYRKHNQLSRELFRVGVYQLPVLPLLGQKNPEQFEEAPECFTQLTNAANNLIIYQYKSQISLKNTQKSYGFLYHPISRKVYLFGRIAQSKSKKEMLLQRKLFDDGTISFEVSNNYFSDAIEAKNDYRVGIVVIGNDGKSRWIISNFKHRIVNS